MCVLRGPVSDLGLVPPGYKAWCWITTLLGPARTTSTEGRGRDTQRDSNRSCFLSPPHLLCHLGVCRWPYISLHWKVSLIFRVINCYYFNCYLNCYSSSLQFPQLTGLLISCFVQFFPPLPFIMTIKMMIKKPPLIYSYQSGFIQFSSFSSHHSPCPISHVSFLFIIDL